MTESGVISLAAPSTSARSTPPLGSYAGSATIEDLTLATPWVCSM